MGVRVQGRLTEYSRRRSRHGTVGDRRVTERETSVSFMAQRDRVVTLSPVLPSAESVLSQVPPADRSALQDSMGLAVEQVLALPGMTGTVIVAGATGERR